MSYILFNNGSSLTTPVSIANGGTAGTTPAQALENLASITFSQSALNPNWGTLPVPLPPSPDPNDLFTSITELITMLGSANLALIQEV